MRCLIPLLLLGIAACRPIDAGAPIAEGPDLAVNGQERAALRLADLRVIDGDTFEMDGETIRIANIDTPEKPPRAKCMAEAHLGDVATRGLADALGSGWETDGKGLAPSLRREGKDQYGRTLARVSLTTGEDVGDLMVARGYAVRWSGRRADWCGTPAA